MSENNIDIEQIKNEINKLKIEILEKEKKIDELLKIINNEYDFDEDIEEVET